MVGDDLFGEGQIGIQQAAVRVVHCVSGQIAHFAQLIAQPGRLLVVGSTHGPIPLSAGTLTARREVSVPRLAALNQQS